MGINSSFIDGLVEGATLNFPAQPGAIEALGAATGFLGVALLTYAIGKRVFDTVAGNNR